MEVTNHLYDLLDQKKYAGIASLDLSKAYDSISHSLLLHKLKLMGFGSECIQWVKSYLENRQQVCKFKNYSSKEETVLSGIPQGSIIGPILFVIFTNDLADVFTDCKMVSYADDCQLIVHADSLSQLQTKLEEVISIAQKWYEENSMKNNIGKTEILILKLKSHTQNGITIQVNDEGELIHIKPKNVIKILGLHLDESLNWTRQVSEVRRKALMQC